jgi:hypothetical protein
MTTSKFVLTLPAVAFLLVLPGAAQAQCGGPGPQGSWCGVSCGGYGVQDPRCYGRRSYRPQYGYGYYNRRDRDERRERRRRDFYEDRRYYWR